MKRKIAALLLSLSMLTVYVVPAGGADFTSGPETDIVQDAETAETETVPEMESADGTETAQETLQASENQGGGYFAPGTVMIPRKRPHMRKNCSRRTA